MTAAASKQPRRTYQFVTSARRSALQKYQVPVTGEVYQWGSPTVGSLPVARFSSFFVEYYVSSMIGAAKA